MRYVLYLADERGVEVELRPFRSPMTDVHDAALLTPDGMRCVHSEFEAVLDDTGHAQSDVLHGAGGAACWPLGGL